MYICEYCNASFSRIDNLKRHQNSACVGKRQKLEEAHSSNAILCEMCNEYVNRQNYSAHLRSNKHKRNAFVCIDDGVEKIVSAFGDRIVNYRITENDHLVDMAEFGYRIREKIINLLQSVIDMHRTVKVNLECFGLYYLNSSDNVEIKSFNTKNKIVTVAVDLYKTYGEFLDEIMGKMSEFQERDSGWTLVQILYMELNCNKYNPTRASSYIDLPISIKLKKAVINVQNQDNYCFAWALTSALHQPTGLPQRISSYPNFLETCLDYSDLEFPVSLRSIPNFEQKNNISINVYGLNECFNGEKMIHEVVTLNISQQKRERHVNLLLLTDDSSNSHFCWIKNLSRLISSQTSLNGHEKYICEGCLVYFSTEENLIRHQSDDCMKVKAILPTTNIKINKYGQSEKENILQFENFEKQLKHPFVIYADFEALLKSVGADEERMREDDGTSYTIKCFEHEPYAFAYYIKCSYDDSLSKFESYRGRNAANEFMLRLENDVKSIYTKHLSKVKEMIPLDALEEIVHNASLVCHICEKEIKNMNEKVYDHDHLTGLYRGAAHSVCNLNYQVPKFIPVFFHNLSNYDSHMFVKNIALKEEEVDVIAQNKEKYITFSKKVNVGEIIDCKGKKRKVFMKIRFLDSFRFMSCSLEKLGSFLEDDQCIEIKNFFNDIEKFSLIRQKGVFPYSFVDCFEKLNYPQVPEREHFYDLLTDKNISDENYARVQRVWNVFNCQNLGEYSDVYLRSDVLLLADIFENFRKISIMYYKLDPSHYYTSPGFGWDALLRMTRVKLELLTDVDMLHFFKKGIRGGLSMCTKRSAIANNKFITGFDVTKPSTYILYLDATNLYGYVMTRKLPTGGFQWLSEIEIEQLDIMNIYDEHIGYVFEVDLEYPQSLHDEHNDLPFCPENIVPEGSKQTKLITNLYNKINYIIHYENLQQCLKHGLKILKIHRALRFQQSDWMRKYIDFNSAKRRDAKNVFENNHYKSMINVVYGKTMENVENRVDIRLATHWENRYRKAGVETLIANPNFKSSKIFCENLAAIELNIVQFKYNKPLYVGFCVLDLSKTVIYDFFYNFLKLKYGENVSLLYTDTDSLILEFNIENIYEDIIENIEKFDTSNYPIPNIHKIPRGNTALGKMKDEYPNRILTSFYGTGSKAYCVTTVNGKEEGDVKKAKGIKKYVIDKHLSAIDYKRIVEEGGLIYKKMYVFRSSYHTMYTELKNKVALSGKDDKRYIMDDRCHTLAWGSKRIAEIENDMLETQRLRRLDNLLALLSGETNT